MFIKPELLENIFISSIQTVPVDNKQKDLKKFKD